MTIIHPTKGEDLTVILPQLSLRTLTGLDKDLEKSLLRENYDKYKQALDRENAKVCQDARIVLE